MRKVYQKLVRDRVPKIIEAKGGRAEMRILSDADFLVELKKKFQEELNEYLMAMTPETRLEEMADIFEIITALGEVEGWTIDQIIECQQKKRDEKGAFKEKIFLEAVNEEEKKA